MLLIAVHMLIPTLVWSAHVRIQAACLANKHALCRCHASDGVIKPSVAVKRALMHC